ncbi:MAG: NAD(+)/NADH kinase [Actinomycetota bacterium]|nr:NAD(+)/NADH kinase [Actinomycetota bacterium]
MSSIGLFMYHDRGSELALDAIDWLTSRGHEVRLSNDQAATLGHTELGVPEAQLSAGLDLMVSLGGDGTMLRAVDLAAADSVPVLGINLGQLGYLTEVEPSGVRMALKRFLAGSYSIEERMRLEVTVHRSGAETERLTALNEAVLEKSEMGHTVRLDVELDGLPFTSYVSDGLILATPTGSTAYAFSVRGPIIDPRHRAVLMSPVAAHMLFDRSLVLQPDCEVRVTVSGHRDAGVSVDGRAGGSLAPGDSVVCTGSARPARLVTFGNHDFHAVLRSKFGLSER